MVDPIDPPFWRDLVSLGAVYGWFLAALAWSRRRRHRASEDRERRPHLSWWETTRRVTETFAGGFLLFVTIMTIYHLLLTGRPWEPLVRVLTANAALVFGLILPSFLALAWIRHRIAHRIRIPTIRSGRRRSDQADSSRSAAARAASAMRST